MSDRVFLLDRIRKDDAPRVGGKAVALASMRRAGLDVPNAVCVTTDVYADFVRGAGLRERMGLELGRKPLADMRWEELWDASLRIRGMFGAAPLPAGIREELIQAIPASLAEGPVAVRSSAPGEDSATRSFAGLHASFVNVRGVESILQHVRLVWASLWSDAALLYRKELGLDLHTSSMAVLIQEFVPGGCSGVVFSQHPNHSDRAVIEAVHGLNQGLVDGSVSPDRWELSRADGRVLSCKRAGEDQHVQVADLGVEVAPLPDGSAGRSPLTPDEVAAVYAMARGLEAQFGEPQDVEWTLRGERLIVLQSRAITAAKDRPEGDRRSWYLSLRRSLASLRALRAEIEDRLLPAMASEAKRLAARALESASDDELIEEMSRRESVYQGWLDRYYRECIPFAHAVRLFGEFYNDAIQPDDPYEFVELLTGQGTISVRRNSWLQGLAWKIRGDGALYARRHSGDLEGINPDFDEALQRFLGEFGDTFASLHGPGQAKSAVLMLLGNMADSLSLRRHTAGNRSGRTAAQFLERLCGDRQVQAKELLDLARASYRIRDDDNIYLGRVAAQVDRARDEMRRRGLPLPSASDSPLAFHPTERPAALAEAPSDLGDARPLAPGPSVHARQLRGQPASAGLAAGLARVIRRPEDLRASRAGEILVCDAIDPGMTYVLPLVAAVVERRGGMLIHGAIIAREYGVPCVTGIADAMTLIETGVPLRVDGYLGIVTLG